MIRALCSLMMVSTILLCGPVWADDGGVEAGDDDWVSEYTHVDLGSGAENGVKSSSTGQETPPCNEVPLGVDCRPVTICFTDPSSPTGGMLHIYTGALDGYRFGILQPCDPANAEEPSIDEVVSHALRRVELPESRLVVQPPGGKTLVNFDTIFSTDAKPFERTVRLLGREIVLRIRPSSFSWHFGDDSEPLSTAEPGRAYRRGLSMDSYITHQYTDANATVHPRVDTTYSAEYSVDGQPFQPVIGTVTIDGAPVSLRVVEARPVLTGTR